MVTKEPKDRIIVALDVNDPEAAYRIAIELTPYVGLFKAGLELITAGLAPVVIKKIHAAGGRVFYDGKFNDIPNTVARASIEATRLGVAMFNVHCSCGEESLKAAVKATKETHQTETLTKDRPLILGVTILTSLRYYDLLVSQVICKLRLRAKGEAATAAGKEVDWVKTLVVQYAQLAQRCGLDGVIASPQEITAIRQACGRNFMIVTPGVRPAGAALNDQKRVMTPAEAIKAGADYLVIGRPILKPETGTRVEAAQRIAEEIASVL